MPRLFGRSSTSKSVSGASTPSLTDNSSKVTATQVDTTTTTATVPVTSGYAKDSLLSSSSNSSYNDNSNLKSHAVVDSTLAHDSTFMPVTSSSHKSTLSAQEMPNAVNGAFTVTSLGAQELNENVQGKVLRLGEHTGFTIDHPEICVAQEKLLIKHQPINVAQPPVVIQPEAISIPQQPFMWQPEPIAIPLPPLTIQPEPITIQRPDLVIQPDSYVLHRPNLVLNPSFNIRLTHPGQCPDGSVCVPASQSSSLGATSNVGSTMSNNNSNWAGNSSNFSGSSSNLGSSNLGSSNLGSSNRNYNV